MRKRIPYILTACIALSVCVWIFFRSTGFVRYHAGDFFIVILIYSCGKTIVSDLSPWAAGAGVFLSACTIELLQSGVIPAYFNTSGRLVAATLGSTFDWIDLPAYLAGTVTIMSADRILIMKKRRR